MNASDEPDFLGCPLDELARPLPVPNGVGMVNTFVRLEYETQDPGECISHVKGQDLGAALPGCQNRAVGFTLLATLFAGLPTWAAVTVARMPTQRLPTGQGVKQRPVSLPGKVCSMRIGMDTWASPVVGCPRVVPQKAVGGKDYRLADW